MQQSQNRGMRDRILYHPPVARPKGSVFQTPGGKWRVRWWTSDGRHPSKTFDRKTEADRFLKAARGEAYKGDVPSHLLLTKAAIDSWWRVTETSLKPRTADRYLNHVRIIERHLAKEPLVGLDYDRLQDFVLDLQQTYAPKTVTHTWGVLSLILKHAEKRGMIAKQIAKPTLPRIARPRLTIPSRDEVELLADASQAWLYGAVILAGYCGLRQGELLALHRSDVNLSEGWVFIHQARNKSSGELESTKTDSVRRVHLPNRVREAMTEHLDEYQGAVVFPPTASVFDKSWRRSRASVDLENVRFHDLRHAAASMMIAAGGTILQVSKQLGHANPTQTLDTYGHLWPDSFEDLMARMNTYLAH